MKRLKKYLLFILLLILIPSVNAEECSNAEKVALGKEAVEVKVGYEEVQGVLDSDHYEAPEGHTNEEYKQYYYYFTISFYNITENLAIEYSINGAQGRKNITYNHTNNGTFSFNKKDIMKPSSISYKVIGSEESSCPGTVLYQGKKSLPAYNIHSTNIQCQEYPDFELCKTFLSSVVTYDVFEKKLEEQKPSQKNEFLVNLKKFFNKHKIIILVSVTLVAGLVIGFVIRYRRKRVI